MRAARREPSIENRATLAILYLVEGYPRAAVSLLRTAQGQRPHDPRLLSDLAAALLALSRETGDPWPALEAIEAAQLSLRLRSSPQALFNEALALERCVLRSRAAAAWHRYLDRSTRSDWTAEAARRLERLNRGTFSPPQRAQNLWASRQRGERLLGRWAELSLSGHLSEAASALDEAEALTAILHAGAGRLLAASIAAIRDAERAADRARRDRLAYGHRAYEQAFRLWRGEEDRAADALLDGAIRDLRAADSPFELSARTLRARVAAEPDWSELRRLSDVAQRRGFPSLAAEVQWIRAYRISLEGRLERAVGVYGDTRERFEALGEREASAVISAMIVELLDALNRNADSPSSLAAALAAGPWAADPRNRYSLYVVAASAVKARFSRAAVELRLEAADACSDLPERPLCAVDSWSGVATLTSEADLAVGALDRARELLLKTPRSEGTERTRIDLDAARAQWLAADDHSAGRQKEAEALYREAAARYKAKGQAVSAARAHAARATILSRLGRPEEAAEEYRASLVAIRRWDQADPSRPADAESRSPRELREVYDRLIDIELSTDGAGPHPAAFLLSEEMRDRMAPGRSGKPWVPKPADLARFKAAVPPGTAVVEYAMHDQRGVAWILAGGHLEAISLASRTRLEPRIRSLVRGRDLAAWRQSSGELFEDLLAPVLERLPAGIERLVLVPDSDLYGLPFRALWDPTSGRYLDEEFAVALSPSVRQLLGFGSRNTAASAAHWAVLSLGVSEFDLALGVEPLPGAAREAAAVRAVYGGTAATECRATDWTGFCRCAPQADVLHLATHAAADSTEGERTWLAFERETVSLPRLWRQLPDLPRHPLVVLSACQSVAVSGGGEGLGGLARPFLARGARAVVGTLWRIGDEEAESIFPAFHRAYRDSRDVADALRTARAAGSEWRAKPWAWGAVEAIDGEL